MRKVLVIAIILLQAVGMFGQTRIEQYESIFPKNFVFVSEDENGYNVTKNFTVKAATLTYKADKLESFTLKSSGVAKVTYSVEQMISENSRVKKFWIDRTEKYFVVVAFPLDIEDGMTISFVSNINGDIMFDFWFRKELTKKEKEKLEKQEREKEAEQRERERQEREREVEQRERERQERLRDEKEIREALMELDVTKITSDVTDYFNDKYAREIKRWDRRLSTYELKYVGEVNVLLCVDSLGADIVKVENDIVNGGLNILMQSSTRYYTLDDVTYYKSQNKIFFTKSIQVKTKTYKHGYSGGKNKGRYFKYYVNVPNEVKKACEQNFMKRGEYFFEYTTVDGDVSVKELNGLERKQKDEIRGRKTTGRKILNIGGSMLLVGICVGSLCVGSL